MPRPVHPFPFRHAPQPTEIVGATVAGASESAAWSLAVAAAALATEVPEAAILMSGRGRRPEAQARALAIYLAHVALGLSMAEVARCCARHHSSVAHACALIEDRRDEPAFEAALAGLEDAIRSADHLKRETAMTGIARPVRPHAPRSAAPAGEAGFERISVEVDGERADVLLDLAESPLAWLARRKGRDGRALIDPAQLMAGERLRLDFTRAQMTPRVTADWSGAASGGRNRAPAGLQPADAVLAAKQRLTRALDAVGPEFSGPLMDVCCFLKGIEQVERERGWPARAGKVVLGLGLDRLARHYGLSTRAEGPARARMRAWVAEDGRPRVDGLEGSGAG